MDYKYELTPKDRRNILQNEVRGWIIYLSENPETIYDEKIQHCLEDFWRLVEETEQAGVDCQIYRTQLKMRLQAVGGTYSR